MIFPKPLRLPCLVLVLLVSLGGLLEQRSPPPEPAPPAPTSALAWSPREGPLPAAAAALRQRDLAAVRRLLEPASGEPATTGPPAPVRRLVLGFYAHALEEVELAQRLLAESGGGELEDWRRFLLADAAHAAGHLTVARAALGELLATDRRSPLRAHALLRSAQWAVEAKDSAAALRWIDYGLDGDELAVGERRELAVLAWQIAQEVGAPGLSRDAARRLLVEHPIEASRLKVIELFRQPSGALDWEQILTPAELARRARRLIDDGVYGGALDALDLVALDHREFGWHLLRAEALTHDGRSAEARTLLAALRPATAAERAELSWQRALTELDLATARRGRTLPAAEREAARDRALAELERVAASADDAARQRRALVLLFTELADDDRFDDALAVLQRLRAVDADDRTGARYLWRKGWKEFDGANYSGAIGLWSELGALYPESRFARSGLYWSARAHEALGNGERGRALLREIAAADSTDFYRRHAVVRLGQPPSPGASLPAGPTEPWPQDPLLWRARLLSDLGLDDLALVELEALRPRAEERAADALAALVLARQGQRRDSINALWRAFRSLGGPHQAAVPEAALRLYYPLDYRELVERHAERQGLPIDLVFAIIRQESAFDADAKSRAGARGLMQMMPATGRELARRMGLAYSTERLKDPEFSIRLGTAYFRQVLEMFDGNEELALAGYNGGPYRIKRLWRQAGGSGEVDRFVEGLDLEETKSYVKRIVLFSDSYQRLYGAGGRPG